MSESGGRTDFWDQIGETSNTHHTGKGEGKAHACDSAGFVIRHAEGIIAHGQRP